MSVKIMGYESGITKTVFPGGESCIRVGQNFYEDELTIDFAFESNSDLFDLALVVDALRRQVQGVRLKLFLGYVPYARQDRVCNPGESLSIKVVADFINSLKFERVAIVDPHSDVTPALFNNALVVAQEVFASNVASRVDRDNTIVVSPDAGANKKVLKFAKEGDFHEVVRADKLRDLSTGKILETKVYSEHVGDKDFLIVDDICDGGRTFTELAKELRKLTAGKVNLFVTHGIFSAGTEVFDNLIDEVYTANPVGATGKAAVDSGRVVQI